MAAANTPDITNRFILPSVSLRALDRQTGWPRELDDDWTMIGRVGIQDQRARGRKVSAREHIVETQVQRRRRSRSYTRPRCVVREPELRRPIDESGRQHRRDDG